MNVYEPFIGLELKVCRAIYSADSETILHRKALRQPTDASSQVQNGTTL